MNKIVIDLDNTLTYEESGVPYEEKTPNIEVIEVLKKYKEEGFCIVIFTARNMNSFQGNIGKINANTLPVAIAWLRKHTVPYDEIIVGKPWCGHDGFYVDDRAIRPDEFVKLNFAEIGALLKPRSENIEC